ncbi:MAG: type secretion system outer rane lipoprotein TssJ [Pseudomonadota bacterium]|jgi:type VI secretion system VasD/TssJ family lipoprotein
MSRFKIYSLCLATILCVILLNGCAEKANTVTANNKNEYSTLWEWDDQKKIWLYNGSLFAPKASETTTEWTPKEKAISLTVGSAKSLNAFDNAPKALQMKVFQLSDPTAFLRAAKSTSGLRHLLITEQIDPANLGSERLIILPGTTQNLQFDRLKGTRYIGIICGYSTLKAEQVFRLVPIIAMNDKNIETSANNGVNTQGRPAIIKMELFLGAAGIDKLHVDVK